MMYDPDMKASLIFTAICGILAILMQGGPALGGVLLGIFMFGFIGLIKLAQGVADAGVQADRQAMLDKGLTLGEAEIVAQLRQQRRENF
ncbi:membrane protein [Gordonia phage Neville]|uniref:Membrane protein n=2 Tax=Nevillevirus TaxID=3044773 RepID=A0A515MGV0_9CAUD|nr:membrane protein [Gordonia phage Neville]YP_010245987.1 membrane protein [Gordonia phage Trax]AXQ64376.1 membrane protein [Gordonia phage Neville]QDM55889.1 membrane protein [Gordonia phage Trax]